MPARRFFAILGIIVAVGAVVRVAFVLGVARDDDKFYDAAYYELQAETLARGDGFNDPFQFLPGRSGRKIPAADHPPLTAIALAPVAWVGIELGVDADGRRLMMRFTTALAGLGVVFLVGLLGRTVNGPVTGLVAAGLAAVYPYLWANDGLIMSEAFATLAVVGALLFAYRLARTRSWWIAIALGVVCGLATLARAELALMAPLLALPILWTWRTVEWGRRLGTVALVAAGTAAMLLPWFAFNLSRFEEPVLISTNEGLALIGSNCENVYWGPATGLTNIIPGVCIDKVAISTDQSVVSREYRDRAIEFMRDNPRRVPVVIAARIGRNWSLFRPADMVSWNLNEGRPAWVTRAGLAFYYPLLAGAVAGVVLLRRRRIPQWPVLVPAIIVTVSPILSYGQTRFRATAEPSIVLLASVAIVTLLARWWAGARDEATTRPFGPDTPGAGGPDPLAATDPSGAATAQSSTSAASSSS